MDAEQVVNKIVADAKAQADKITSEAKAKDEAARQKLSAELADFQKQTTEIAKSKAGDKKSRILAAARMDISREMLAGKREQLDEVFVKAAEQIQNMDTAEYQELMAKLMTKAVETGDEEVIVDTNETRIDQDLLNRVNEQLGSEYKKNLTLCGQRQNIGSGFIMSKGKIKINVSLKILMKQAREELEIVLAKELFEDQSVNG